jgi:phospholipid/cholesterol/gamma-HCH transport system permease protein
MSDIAPNVVKPAWRIERSGNDSLLLISGDWLVRETGIRTDADQQLVIVDAGNDARLHFDTSGLGRWDSALVVFVHSLEIPTATGRRLDLDPAGLPDALQRLLALARTADGSLPAVIAKRRRSLAERVGRQTLALGAAVRSMAALIGAALLSVGAGVRGRLCARASDVVLLLREAGSGALAIVTIVNCLVGAILAFVGAVQLRRFGADVYVVNLVGVAMVREMAPMMTAIVMAGRTGAAYAAQIATMQGNEEIDALQVLGIPLDQYLVVPRVLALVTMMPLLYFYACAVGIAGGLVVSAAMLNMSPTVFLEQLRPAVLPAEFLIGLTKSICFGAFIALVGCRIGLDAGRSAADVGRAATDAVVYSIIGIIAIDAVFAACADVLGI